MGGYYGPVSRIKKPQEKCEEALESFLSTKKRSDLLEAYEHIKETGESLVTNLLEVQHKGLEKEFSDYEIEYKANITLASPSKLFSKTQEPSKKDLEKIHSMIKFDYDRVPYLKDTKEPQISVGHNHFYSVNDTECFVLTHKNDNWNTKIKEFTGKYKFGIKGEEFIVKRKKVMGPTNPLDLVNAILKVNKTQDIMYEGFMEKTKADQFLLNIISGRVYNLTISLCKAKDREDLLQLEIEYAGYVPAPGFTKKVNSEKDIVQEIVEIQDYIIREYSNQEVGGYELHITPTTMTKFAWITGKTPEAKAEETKETPLVEEQTFFGDTV